MKTIRYYFLPAILLTIGLMMSSSGLAADAPKKIQVLLLTGDDVSPAHNWAEVSQAIKETLLAAGNFQVTVCEDAGVLDSANLNRYDVVFLHLYNAKTPAPSPSARLNLVNFVKGGKGLVVSHLSSASWADFSEFRAMCGRYWVMGKSGHGPRSTFAAKVIKKDNPITRGIEDFQADDELYAKLQGDASINVLVEADSDDLESFVPVFPISSHDMRQLDDTRRAPARPEVHQHDAVAARDLLEVLRAQAHGRHVHAPI